MAYGGQPVVMTVQPMPGFVAAPAPQPPVVVVEQRQPESRYTTTNDDDFCETCIIF